MNGIYTNSKTDLNYDIKFQIDLIRKRLKDIQDIAEDYSKHKTFEELQELLNRIFAIMWDESYIFKSSHFQYENEFRLTLCKLDKLAKHERYDKTHFMVTQNNIKQYKDIDGFDSWNDIITDIIISPYNTSSIVKDSIYDFLNYHNINIQSDKIRSSCCPIRTL